nr:MAG TPA: 5'(3')-deoxyribonucleotidase [Caudoviricetes sp.]
MSNDIILCDYDSVLNDMLITWINWLNNKHGTQVSVNEVCNWDMTKVFPTLSKEEIFEPLYNEYFWLNVPVSNNYIDVIKEMKKDNIVYIVTDSDYRTIKAKMEDSILNHFGNVLKASDIIFTSHKDIIKCDYIIDDYEENIKNSDGIRILIDKPYNRNCPLSYYDVRVKNISEAWDFIKLHKEITSNKF